MTKLKCFLKHKSCLWHWTLGCVHKQYNTVYHFKNTLYLTTEISMTWGVDNVYLNVLILDRSILCKDSDSSLTLDIV